MILQSLIGTCFFAGIVAILSVPWMLSGSDNNHDRHGHGH
jgi:hypothetical protein